MFQFLLYFNIVSWRRVSENDVTTNDFWPIGTVH